MKSLTSEPPVPTGRSPLRWLLLALLITQCAHCRCEENELLFVYFPSLKHISDLRWQVKGELGFTLRKSCPGSGPLFLELETKKLDFTNGLLAFGFPGLVPGPQVTW